MLKLITGDAIYTQRPLAEALLDENCDYLLQVKGNQPDIQDALQHCLRFHGAIRFLPTIGDIVIRVSGHSFFTIAAT